MPMLLMSSEVCVLFDTGGDYMANILLTDPLMDTLMTDPVKLPSGTFLLFIFVSLLLLLFFYFFLFFFLDLF